MVTREVIQNFLAPKKMAIAGVSRDPNKFGYKVYNELNNKGYELYPINPKTDTINGNKCYKDVASLPLHVKHLLILTPKSQTDKTLREAIGKGITNIWVQQMSETEETIKIAEEYEMEPIMKKCIFMFAEPVAGFHNFHRTLLRIFGMLPR
jgi:uncharacterized protein